jgi:hypothetical protein
MMACIQVLRFGEILTRKPCEEDSRLILGPRLYAWSWTKSCGWSGPSPRARALVATFALRLRRSSSLPDALRMQAKEADAERERINFEGPHILPNQLPPNPWGDFYLYWDREQGTRPWPNFRRELPPGFYQLRFCGYLPCPACALPVSQNIATRCPSPPSPPPRPLLPSPFFLFNPCSLHSHPLHTLLPSPPCLSTPPPTFSRLLRSAFFGVS